MRRFPLFHMATIKYVFPRKEDYSFIKTRKGENIARSYGSQSKRALAIQVFHAFMKNMLEDVIENNTVVELPLYKAAILIEQMPEEVFKRLREKGKLKFYITQYNGGKVYVPVYRYKKKGKNQKFRMILGKTMFNRLVELVNIGKRYFGYTSHW